MIAAPDLPPAHPIVRYVDDTRAAIIDASPFLGRFLVERSVPSVALLPAGLTRITVPGAHPLSGEQGSVRALAFIDRASARMVLTRPAAAQIRQVVRQRADEFHREDAMRLVIHEHLHMVGAPHAERAVEPGDALIEEGIVSAVTEDLMHSVADRTWPAETQLQMIRSPVYPRCALTIRVVSSVMAGLPVGSWRRTAARRMRIALLTATPESRREAITRAGYDPAAVC